MKNWVLTTALLLISGFAEIALAADVPSAALSYDVSDAALVKSMSGFENDYATVNGVRLHFVAGGKGPPVLLLPGWPETWWSFYKIMPQLAEHHRVIAVDLRGMGGSDKPAEGYDKKMMAKDIFELVHHLGYDKVDLVGHDIGAMVAFSFAANYPESTRRLVLLDVPHPDAKLASWPLLPTEGTFGDKIDENHAYAWWFAFHQVRGLPEQILAGREYLEQEWFFKYLLYDESAISPRDRAVYAAAYASRDAIRAGNAWYQAFPRDINDDKSYSKLEMPVLGLAGPGYNWLKDTLERHAANVKVVKIPNCGHFIAEEKPDETIRYLNEFLEH
jgi:pimeloyl-ACP methyl ester carboxylesterase